jgi:hypothetical protein
MITRELESQRVQPEAVKPRPDSLPQRAQDDFAYWRYCDNCGAKLENFRCRLVCPKCGFFHSCSEP